MTTQRFIYPALLTVLLLTLASCRSSRSISSAKGGVKAGTEVGNTPPTADLTKASALAWVSEVEKASPAPAAGTCLSARVKVQLSGLGKDVSASGQLRMKRDDVVQLSVTFLGMEVGRLEFTPAEVLVVDRMNKQYVRTSYADIRFLRQAGLDFYALQSLFWNELFVPGQRSVAGHENSFRLSETQNAPCLSLADTPKLVYRFTVDADAKCVSALNVSSRQSGEPGNFSWTYSGFEPFGNRLFPTEMQMAVTGTPHDGGFTLRLSRLGNDSGWSTRTKLSDKYVRRSADEVLGKLGL